MDFVNYWRDKTDFPKKAFMQWLGLPASTFFNWQMRYGKENQHNGRIPRDWWLEEWEKKAIIDYFYKHPDEGYRRLAFMMMDENIVAVSPTTVWRVLNKAGLLKKYVPGRSMKGKGFTQPTQPHQHWHVDISYVNLCGTFYYLCSVLDGLSRKILHWEIRESMREVDVEIILQRAREAYPEAHPRVITDNGSQFIARDFKLFIRICGMTHVRTSPYYPQSNGKIERWHQTLKRECLRPGTPLTIEDARRLVGRFVDYYNTVRLHSAIGYVSPQAKYEGRENQIWAERDRKLEEARKRRKERRKQDVI